MLLFYHMTSHLLWCSWFHVKVCLVAGVGFFDLREGDAFGAGAGYVGEGEPVEWSVRMDAGAINESRV